MLSSVRSSQFAPTESGTTAADEAKVDAAKDCSQLKLIINGRLMPLLL